MARPFKGLDVTNYFLLFLEGGSKAGKIMNAIVYIIVKDNLPLNTTTKPGFLNLMKTVTPLYKVPSRMTVTQIIDVKYDLLSVKIKDKLRKLTPCL